MTTIATQLKNAHVEYDEDRNYHVKCHERLSDDMIEHAVDWFDQWEDGIRTYIFKDGSQLVHQGGELTVVSIAKELFTAYKITDDFSALEAALEERAMEVEDTDRGTEYIFTDTSRIVTSGCIVCFLDLE